MLLLCGTVSTKSISKESRAVNLTGCDDRQITQGVPCCQSGRLQRESIQQGIACCTEGVNRHMEPVRLDEEIVRVKR